MVNFMRNLPLHLDNFIKQSSCNQFLITKEQIENAQQVWADGVIKIGSLKNDRAACEDFTNLFIDKVYAFELGDVLFKPTRASLIPFRKTKRSALSYFIGGDEKYSEDLGFALQPWKNVRFKNSAFIIDNDRAIVMGNYFFTNLIGDEFKFEFTFGYRLYNGELKIDLHHSSIPFTPPPLIYFHKNSRFILEHPEEE